MLNIRIETSYRCVKSFGTLMHLFSELAQQWYFSMNFTTKNLPARAIENLSNHAERENSFL